jgi:hypothetical protein
MKNDYFPLLNQGKWTVSAQMLRRVATQPSGHHCVFKALRKQMSWYLKTRCITEGASEWLVGRRVSRSSGDGKHTRRAPIVLAEGI